MLRHYEKCGLLYPAEIDKFTGYRQYSAGQIPLVNRIVTLRDFGFSIDEIGDTLPHYDDAAYMHRVLRARAATMKKDMEALREKIDLLTQLSDTVQKERNIMIYEVELKKLPSIKVLTLRGNIPHYRDEGMLWEKLGRYIGENGIQTHEDGYSTYFDEEYQEENPDVEVAIPVDTLGKSEGEYVYREYDAIPLAATVRFSGPMDGGYDAASEKLADWMEKNGYAFAGHLRGHVIVAPDTEPDQEKWRTELQAPVVKK
jgi:effector-binding domain-containing protein